MIAFDAAAARTLATVFARFGRTASYSAPDGGEKACSIIVDRADDVGAIGETPIVAGQFKVEVRATELAAPEKQGVFTLDAVQYRIVAKPRRDDPDGLVWSCLCVAAPWSN